MGAEITDDEFVPATSEREAASRLFALAGRQAEATRGPKRALAALARALDLDVDLVATNGVLGRQIASALDVEWSGASQTRTSQVTLDGLNILLRAAAKNLGSSRRGRLSETPHALAGWSEFRPARSKIEAVNRISALTRSGAEVLGPGSKERKSVLENLARKAFPEIDTSLSKTELGAALASAMDVPWTDACYSTGYTISLDGLNTTLAGAERFFGVLGREAREAFPSAAEEGAALAAALRERLPAHWDGRRCVRQMRDFGYTQWRQTEWPGWYHEFLGLPALNDTFAMAERGGPRRRFGSTTFDYAFGWVWDLKTHTERKVFTQSGRGMSNSPDTLLNDADAARACIRRQGLGFLVLGGDSHFEDDGAFDDWHRSVTRTDSTGRVRSNSGRSRLRKSAFTPRRCTVFWVPDECALDQALAAGQIKQVVQGRQQARGAGDEGAARADKLVLRGKRAATLRVAEVLWS